MLKLNVWRRKNKMELQPPERIKSLEELRKKGPRTRVIMSVIGDSNYKLTRIFAREYKHSMGQVFSFVRQLEENKIHNTDILEQGMEFNEGGIIEYNLELTRGIIYEENNKYFPKAKELLINKGMWDEKIRQ
ncbi:hypothetical protein KAT80_02900 [Candidatus Pacearchaeota archaeon]|nr:hypothetical protein [Candidatus Pacearchaeota archaeon]